jgi:uncharacterized protein YcgI (DUF1989 family)
MTGEVTTVGGGEAGTFRVASGGTIRVINTLGGQVVDAWFRAADDPAGFASKSHSRAFLRTIRPAVGCTFVTRRREPLMTLVADSSPGVHDMTMPPCDEWRYRQLGAPGHRNCADNLRSELRVAGHEAMEVLPDPLNLFQNSPYDAAGNLTFLESPAPAGSSVTLRADRDLVVYLSVCPMDIMPINGGVPRSIGVAVLDPGEAR